MFSTVNLSKILAEIFVVMLEILNRRYSFHFYKLILHKQRVQAIIEENKSKISSR